MPMPMTPRHTLRLIWAGMALAAALLASSAWLTNYQLREQRRQAAVSELEAVANERKHHVNAFLARFSIEVAAGLPETSPERMAELAALVNPRHSLLDGDVGHLLDSEGRDITAPEAQRLRPSAALTESGFAAARCLAGNDGRASQRDEHGNERMVIFRTLPVHGLCLLVSADLREMPIVDFQWPAGLLAMAIVLLLGIALLATRAIRAAALTEKLTRREQEVTDKKEAIQRLLPSGISQSDFLGRVSHEIRTPLNGVLGTVELLMKTALDPQQRELVELARTSSGHLLAAIDDILENPSEQPTETDAETAPHFPGSRVLLVEDNATNQIVAKLMLTDLGCMVEIAADGRDALRMLERSDYDVIFMDCEMPGLDGYATTASIRKRLDHKARLPIVAVTAQAMPGDRERCLAAGMDDYLSKPVTEGGLARALRRWLKHPETEIHASAVELLEVTHNGPAIEPAVIARLRELAQATDPTLLNQILDAFRSDVAQHIASLQAAEQEGHIEAMRSAAHVIKGASGTVGAMTLMSLAQRVDTLTSDTPNAQVRVLVELLSREFARATDEIVRLQAPRDGSVAA